MERVDGSRLPAKRRSRPVRLNSATGCRIRITVAGARDRSPFVGRRKHVVVHADRHRDEDNGVVEQVQFHTWKDQLEHAGRDRRPPEIVLQCGLNNQQGMLNMVPELDPEREGPPLQRNALEALTKYPEADQHDDGIPVMHRLRRN